MALWVNINLTEEKEKALEEFKTAKNQLISDGEYNMISEDLDIYFKETIEAIILAMTEGYFSYLGNSHLFWIALRNLKDINTELEGEKILREKGYNLNQKK